MAGTGVERDRPDRVLKWVGLASGVGVDCKDEERSRETQEMAAEWSDGDYGPPGHGGFRETMVHPGRVRPGGVRDRETSRLI